MNRRAGVDTPRGAGGPVRLIFREDINVLT
jgi:hypothetical protein